MKVLDKTLAHRIGNKILVHRIANDLCSENTKFYGDRVFCFPVGGYSVF